jgi:putative ABC transport system permease protein
LFGEGADAVGESVRINGLEFRVIGITESKGGTGFQNQDDIVYIPLRSAQRFLSGDQYLSSINIQAESADDMTLVQEEVTALLTARHRIKEGSDPDFTVLNQSEILSTASTITATLTYLLAAIGGISLLVGGIGIMNMMLTNVTERTREIGLRKAIGAKPRDIAQQFLAEAVALTLIGGVIGIALGWGISYAVNLTGAVTTKVTLSSVILAFGVSGATGIIFGYYPARRAAKLNPIDALRYE